MAKPSQTHLQLARRYTRNYVTLDEFRLDHMPHINNTAHLLRILKEHPIPLKITRLHYSQRAQRVIFLTDLADWLEQIEAAAKAA